jgi:hypothetical protein
MARGSIGYVIPFGPEQDESAGGRVATFVGPGVVARPVLVGSGSPGGFPAMARTVADPVAFLQ